MAKIEVRPIEAGDQQVWHELYGEYARFYNSPQTKELRDKVWGWLQNEKEALSALVAVNKKSEVVGFAHIREFLRPLAASKGLFLDDLFVAPASRGSGAAEALIAAIRKMAEKENYSLVRWVTADNNYRARAVYDRVARKTDWLTYDIQL